jgi:hypothetical protein
MISSDNFEVPGLDEQTAFNRVHMLRRARRLLISEWHPILDKVIGDYERGLEMLRAAREPLEVDDTLVREHASTVHLINPIKITHLFTNEEEQ